MLLCRRCRLLGELLHDWGSWIYAELARDAREAERHNRLEPLDEPVVSHLAACLPGGAPIVAASDYVSAYPQLIAAYVEARFVALGTDGFGRSDTRQALRSSSKSTAGISS